MNADVLVVMLLAAADICLIVYLRRRHARSVCTDRMTRSLQLHIQTVNAAEAEAPPRRRRFAAHA